MYLPHGSPQLVQAAQALDLAKTADLEKLRDWYFDCLLVCTAVVGLGLGMEAAEIGHDVWGIFRRKSIERKYWLTPSIDRKEYRARDWARVLSAVGWLVIVLGVMGEGVSEAFVHKYDTALSTLNDTLIANTQKEAKQLGKDAEGERLARVQIQEALAWRTLNECEIFSSRLLPFQGQPSAVWYNAGDAEGTAFAWEMARALHAFKWNVFSPAAFLDIAQAGQPFTPAIAEAKKGIEVARTNDRNSQRAADALVEALNACGFDAAPAPKIAAGTSPMVWVNIGTRPNGPQGESKLRAEREAKAKSMSK